MMSTGNHGVLVVGPSSGGLKGGQVTHMENMKSLFGDSVSCFYSSSGKEGTESLLVKFMRLIGCWFSFPFFLSGTKVVHLNTSFDSKAVVRDIVLMLWVRILGRALVVQYHGGNPNTLSLLKLSLARRPLSWILLKAKVLVLTDSQCDWLRSELLVPSVKVKNYVSLPRLDFEPSNIVRFVFVGRVVREKGVFEIVKSASLLRNLSFEVCIYGVGEDESELLAFIKELDVEALVTFRGSVSGRDKEDAFLRSDVFLYPSYYPEGLPYSVLEAMSYKSAIICTEAGALRDLLQDKVTCLKVDMQSEESLAVAMKVMIVDAETRLTLAGNARTLIEEELSLPVLKNILLKVWSDEGS